MRSIPNEQLWDKTSPKYLFVAILVFKKVFVTECILVFFFLFLHVIVLRQEFLETSHARHLLG